MKPLFSTEFVQASRKFAEQNVQFEFIYVSNLEREIKWFPPNLAFLQLIFEIFEVSKILDPE